MPIITPPSQQPPIEATQQNSLSIDQIVGANLRRLRQQKGLSQAEFSEHFDFALPQLQAYEQGETRIGAETLQKICAFFEVGPSAFFGEENDQIKSYLCEFIDAVLNKNIEIPPDLSAEDMLAHMRRYLALSAQQRNQLNQNILALLGHNT